MDEINVFSKFCRILGKPVNEIVMLPRFAESNAIFMSTKITYINFKLLIKSFNKE